MKRARDVYRQDSRLSAEGNRLSRQTSGGVRGTRRPTDNSVGYLQLLLFTMMVWHAGSASGSACASASVSSYCGRVFANAFVGIPVATPSRIANGTISKTKISRRSTIGRAVLSRDGESHPSRASDGARVPPTSSSLSARMPLLTALRSSSTVLFAVAPGGSNGASRKGDRTNDSASTLVSSLRQTKPTPCSSLPPPSLGAPTRRNAAGVGGGRQTSSKPLSSSPRSLLSAGCSSLPVCSAERMGDSSSSINIRGGICGLQAHTRAFASGSSSRTASRRRRAREASRPPPRHTSRLRARNSGAEQRDTGAADVRQDFGGVHTANDNDGEPNEHRREEGEDKTERRQQEHLPYGSKYHVPVVCEEVLEWLITDPEGVYVDCTLGGGGHSAALLEALGQGARVVGLDRDPDALREASKRLSMEIKAERFQAVRSNFADIGEAVRGCDLLQGRMTTDSLHAEGESDTASRVISSESGPESGFESESKTRHDQSDGDEAEMGGGGLVDGILVDLGVSSHQIDDRDRGFSFSADGPLDMRMEGDTGVLAAATTAVAGGDASTALDRLTGGGTTSAADVVNFADEMEIREMVWRYGDEKRSTKIARAIVENRPISTTGHLADVVGNCAPPNQRMKTLARVFQALRIEVNGELDALEALLEKAKHIVKPGGRLLILSYHSLEDRRVKRVLATGNLKGKVVKDFYGNALSPWKPLLRKPLMAGEREVELNPRARSVRLRVAERTNLPP